MKKQISIKGLMGALVVAAFLGGLAQAKYGFAVGVLLFGVLVALAICKPLLQEMGGFGISGDAVGAAIEKEVWQDHIEGNLFRDNEFLLMSTDASQYVVQGKIVHIPQAGSKVGVEVSRSELPASVTERTDTDITYTLEPYSTDPIKIPNAQLYELSYNKRESVLTESEAALNERIGDEMLRKWSPTTAACIIRTTGEAVATHLAATTGQRKKLTVNDIKTAQLTMNKQKVSRADRYCLISSDMYNQLTDDMTATQYRDFSVAMDPKTGVLGMLYGFKIMQRSETVIYNAGATAVNAFGAGTAATDNDAALCWQKGAVERAVGSITAFENLNDPTYYADIYSFEVRAGGRIRRSGQEGLVAIVQDAPAGV